MSPGAATAVPTIEPAQLPDDPGLLKAMLAEVLAALRASRQEGGQLRRRLDQLLRRLYGPRSERLHVERLAELLPGEWARAQRGAVDAAPAGESRAAANPSSG